MTIENLHLATIEELCDEYIDWDYRYLQLSSGSLNYNAQIVKLPGIELHWRSFGAKVLLKENYRGSDLWFGFCFDSYSPPLHQGQSCNFGDALVWCTDQEQEYVISPSTSTLVIQVDASIIKQRGWTIIGKSLQFTEPRQLMKLLNICRSITHTVNDATKLNTLSTLSYNFTTLSDYILNALELTLSPWLIPQLVLNNKRHKKNNYYQIFKDSCSQLDNGLPLQIDNLAQSLGITKRKLFRAFQQFPNIGPFEYMQIVKLHLLRNKLIAACPNKNTSVTLLAGECGFKELGRLSVAYRKHFGESPSATLKYRNV